MSDTSASDAERHVWSLGDYTSVARRLLPISLDLLDLVSVKPGDLVLDVGTGDGNTAIEAARLGATVTGVDLTPAQIAKARKRAADAGVTVELAEADAAALPQSDASYDTVVSVMGMIFAPDHERATRELARVCRPGGQVAITSWLNGPKSWFQTWRRHAVPFLPASQPGRSDPDAWGVTEEMQRRLEVAGLDARVDERPFFWEFPSVQDGLDYFVTKAGPFVVFLEAMAARGLKEEATAALVAALEEANEATDGSLRLNAPYLVAVAHR